MILCSPLFRFVAYFIPVYLWLGCLTSSYAQCRYISTNEKLDATCPEYIFECGVGFPNRLSISFALRSNKSGYIIMSDNPYFDVGFSYGNYFSDAFILLDDESIIKLIHRNFEWTVNGEHFVRYNLTAGEMLQMAKINIRSVRYTIKPDMNGSTELINSECKEWSQYSKESSVTPRVDFPHLISELIK